MKTVGIVVLVIGLFIGGVYALATYSPQTESSPTNTINDVVKSVEVPKLVSSSERNNVAERAKRFDTPDRISYIYLINYGKVMAFYTVKGKVSSLNSYMTPEQKLVNGYGEKCDTWTVGACYVVDSPDVDGTYGNNIDGIFFFTTEGAYVEWRGDYMMSDQPLKLTTPPELIREIK